MISIFNCKVFINPYFWAFKTNFPTLISLKLLKWHPILYKQSGWQFTCPNIFASYIFASVPIILILSIPCDKIYLPACVILGGESSHLWNPLGDLVIVIVLVIKLQPSWWNKAIIIDYVFEYLTLNHLKISEHILLILCIMELLSQSVSLTHSLTHSLSLAHSLTGSLARSLAHLITHPLIL